MRSKATVKTVTLLSAVFAEKETAYRVEIGRVPRGHVRVIFDETMYVDPVFGFHDQANALLARYLNRDATPAMLTDVGNQIDALIHYCRQSQLLYTAAEAPPDLEGWTCLHGSPRWEFDNC